MRRRRCDRSPGSRKRLPAIMMVGAAVAAETAAVRRRGYGFGGRVVVRCRDGHLFTTLWLPGVSVKALRLGPWRFQRCPVGHHWSLVTPVDRSSLSEDEASAAAGVRDTGLP